MLYATFSCIRARTTGIDRKVFITLDPNAPDTDTIASGFSILHFRNLYSIMRAINAPNEEPTIHTDLLAPERQCACIQLNIGTMVAITL
tara:strand:+ start:312 stop:578 length:267 start_codon:yes stop_codon:yes gene_type:complete